MGVESGRNDLEALYAGSMRPRLGLTVEKLRETRTAKLGVTSDFVVHVFVTPSHNDYFGHYLKPRDGEVGVLIIGNMFPPTEGEEQIPSAKQVRIEFTMPGDSFPPFKEEIPTDVTVFRKVFVDYLRKLVDPDAHLSWSVQTYAGLRRVDPRTGGHR